VSSVDSDGVPLSLFRGVEAVWYGVDGKSVGDPVQIDMEDAPFCFYSPGKGDVSSVELKMFFIGHYNEPALVIKENFKDFSQGEETQTGKRIEISINPMKDTEWTVNSETVVSKEKEEEEAEVAGARELDPEKYPRKIIDERHLAHPLQLINGVYDHTSNPGVYRCNSCLQVGSNWVYHCATCDFDLHPGCAIWRRDCK